MEGRIHSMAILCGENRNSWGSIWSGFGIKEKPASEKEDALAATLDDDKPTIP